MSSFDKKIQTILDGLLSLGNKLNVELITDDPFEGIPEKEGNVAIIHNLNNNNFGMVGTKIEDYHDPVSFFIFNGKLYDYCKKEGFDRNAMLEGDGFKDKILKPVDMEEFFNFMIK